MMKNITLKLKHLVLFTTLAMFSVAASAVNVTYSLTTHVDGRTITATANVAAGGDLLSSMPQALWRAYCTYSFTNEAGEEIDKAPANGGTVYVDYVFDPPFILSEDDGEPVWHFLKHDPIDGLRVFYYSQYHANYYHQYGNDDIFYTQGNLKTGNQTLKSKENAYWAFYGDAYCLNLKFNDVNNVEANDFLTCKITSRTSLGRTTYTYKIETGDKMMLGWQLYVNDALSGSFSLGLPADTHIDQFIWMYDLGDDASIKSLSNGGARRGAQNHITGDDARTFAFMAIPADTGDPSITTPWRVTYKIQKADGGWYPNIIMLKTGSNQPPIFPPTGFTPVEGYEYDYFFKDAEFTEKYPDGYVMPDGENTIIYIKEKEVEVVEYVSTPWMTLVLPYSIDDLTAFFGEDAVQVQEYTSVAGELTEAASESYFTCHLNFTATDKIEAYMPYLFRAVHARQSDLDRMYDILGIEAINEPIEVKLYDNTHAPEIGVSMKGNLAANGYEMPGDGLNFYFGSSQDATGAYAYNFYRRAATIPQFRCYFFVTDERTGGANPIKVRFGSDSLNGISTVAADTNVNAPIYSLDGRKVDASSLSNLQKGIYIVNGRKVVK